jgi:hypothetical protein
MPIPLVVSPTSAMPVWEVDQQATAGASREGDVVAPARPTTSPTTRRRRHAQPIVQ